MSKSTKVFIAILFIFSGLTSLVYEALWIRTLSLSLGSTSTSMSLVLSIFFFGMSMGSFLSGSIIQKIKNPLKAYGLLEGFIGLYSFALIFALTNLSSIVAYLPGTHSSSMVALVTKAIIVLIILGPPTLAMGATLPLLIRTLSGASTSVGKNVSVLYAVNTLGAVLGAYASGFILIPQLGVYGANHLMVVLNLIIFASCWLLSLSKRTASIEDNVQVAKNVSLSSLMPIQKIVVLSAGVVGFASIGAEVIWNKYLSLLLGTNIFGLSLILSIFLFGIALGSFLLSMVIEKIDDKLSFYINLLSLAIVSILLGTSALNWAPVAANILNYYIPMADLLTIKSTLVVVILSIPTSFFGALLPLAVNLVTVENESAPSLTGKIYAVNTWGAILGSALTGLWLIPQFGSGVTLVVLNSVLVLALLSLVFYQTQQKQKTFSNLFKLAAVAFLLVTLPSVKFENIIKSAYYSYLSPGQTFSDVTRFFTKDFEKIVFLAEGKTAIISLNQEADSDGEINPQQLRMKTNGLNESYYDQEYLEVIPKYEGLLGIVPFLHHKNPQKAFIIGYGGGYTTDLLTSLPIPLVHVAEIEGSVLKVADYIHKGDNPITKRKNLLLEIEDARFVLNAKKRGPYDIIVSQPSHSWISGVANLFTKDFFEMAKSNLTEDGVFAQWLNLYNMDLESLKSILHTYYQTFPHGVVYTDEADYQVILLGSTKPLKLDYEKLKQMTADQHWNHRLSFLPFASPEDFLSSFSMGRSKIVETTKGAPINTDTNAYAEIRQSRLFYSTDSEKQMAQPYFSQNFDTSFGGTLQLSEDDKIQLTFKLLKSLGEQQKYDKYFKLMKEFEKTVAGLDKYNEALAEVCAGIERLLCAAKNYQNAFKAKPNQETLNAYLQALNNSEQYALTLKESARHPKLKNNLSQCYRIEAKVNLDHPLPIDLRTNPTKIIGQCGSFAEPLVAQIQMSRGKYVEAIEILQNLVDENPANLKALSLLIGAHLKLKRFASASYYGELFSNSRESEEERLKTLTDYYQQMGWTEDAKWLKQKLNRFEL